MEYWAFVIKSFASLLFLNHVSSICLPISCNECQCSLLTTFQAENCSWFSNYWIFPGKTIAPKVLYTLFPKYITWYETERLSLIFFYVLKVNKIEIFFGFDFEICVISLLVMSKY